MWLFSVRALGWLLVCALLPMVAVAASPTGTLEVVSTPPGLRIVVDGTDTGRRTPGYVAVAPGTHEVAVQSDGETRSRSVSVVAGEAVRLRFTLSGATPDGGPGAVSASYQIPKDIEPGDTEWLAVRGLAGSTTAGEFQGGVDVALFTLRWPSVFWDVLRGGLSMGMSESISFFGGTGAGYALASTDGRHELRVGAMLGYGLVSHGVTAPAGFLLATAGSFPSVRGRQYIQSGGFAVMPQLTYVYHTAPYFSVELGISVLVPFSSPDSVEIHLCPERSPGGGSCDSQNGASDEEEQKLEDAFSSHLANVYFVLGFRI